MSCKVYFLASEIKENWIYVGSTGDLKRRLKEHNCGKTRSTKAYRPLRVVYMESYKTIEEAYNRELYFKSGLGREEKYKILKNIYSGIV